MTQIQIDIPRAFSFLREPSRYKVVYGGRGSGKSHSMARQLILNVLSSDKSVRVLCTRELQNSIKDSVHKLLGDIIDQYNLNQYFSVTEKTIRCTLNGSEFLFKGLKHNKTDIKSTEGIDICWVEEAENVSDASWETLIPTVRDAESEIWVSFNPKHSDDPTYMRFVIDPPAKAVVRKVNYVDNPYFKGSALEDEAEELRRKNPEAFNHIYLGELDARRTGYIYSKHIEAAREAGRIIDVPAKTGVPVITAWDLGKSNATAIWFAQVVGMQVRVIDYHEATGNDADIAALAQVVREKGYVYGGHYLPHDAKHERLGMEGSISAQLAEMGVPNEVLPISSRQAGIESAKGLTQEAFFDKVRTRDGVHALNSYQYEWDEGRKRFKAEPLHDWSSDAADAFRYLAQALALYGYSEPKKPRPKYRRVGSNAWMG